MSLEDYIRNSHPDNNLFIFKDDICIESHPYRLSPGYFGMKRLATADIANETHLRVYYVKGVLMFFGPHWIGDSIHTHTQKCKHFNEIVIDCLPEKENFYFITRNFDVPIYIRSRDYPYSIRDFLKLQEEPKLMQFWKTDLDIIYQ